MSFTIPSVVIENGSENTRAGYSNDEVPPLVFNSHYGQNSQSKQVYIGDDIYLQNKSSNFKDLEIYSLLHDGVIYNWEYLEKNWSYIFDKLHFTEDDKYPLVTTENTWNTKQNKIKTANLAFEKFDVPALSIVKNPLCVTFGLGKSSGLIVDLGAAIASVTGVIDGNILPKSAIRSKFAGDFLSYRAHSYLSQFYKDTDMLGHRLLGNNIATQSFKSFDLNNTLLNNFKSSILASSPYPITEHNMSSLSSESKNFKLPDGRSIKVGSDYATLVESLYKPQAVVSSQDKVNPVQGIVEMILASLNRFRDTPEVISQLLSNIVIVGGTSSIADLDKRLYFDLSGYLQHFHISCYHNPNVLMRHHAVWCGASILSSLNSFDGFVTKKEYQEIGEDGIYERFK